MTNIMGVTYPADSTSTTDTTTLSYRTILGEVPWSLRDIAVVRDKGRPDDSARAWALSLPHGLADGRMVDGPAAAHPPNAGFQKIFVVDPGETHRHHLARVFGIRSGQDALDAVADRLSAAGDPAYSSQHGVLADLCATAWSERPAAHTVLGPVDADHHHVVVPFLQPEAYQALPPTPPEDICAWDISVAVHLLWLAHGGGLLTEEQCDAPLGRALAMARDAYGSWTDYADGVVVGRAVSDGRLDDSCHRFVHDTAVALNHPDSPWFRLNLQG